MGRGEVFEIELPFQSSQKSRDTGSAKLFCTSGRCVEVNQDFLAYTTPDFSGMSIQRVGLITPSKFRRYATATALSDFKWIEIPYVL